MALPELIAQFCQTTAETSSSRIAHALLQAHPDLTIAHRTLRRKIARHLNASPPMKQPDKPADRQPGSASPKVDYNKHYYYQEDSDSYLFFLPGIRSFTFKGETVRELKRRYSDWDGQPATINEICRSFGIKRSLFVKLKTAMGWSHDAEPFTDEEVATRSQDEMLDDLVQTKKFALEQQFERQRLKELEADASKWQELKAGRGNLLESLLRERVAEPVTPLELPTGKNTYAVVLSPYDLHFGKYAWEAETGTEYNREIARRLLLHHTAELIGELAHYQVEKVIVPVGSDFFHVDNVRGETTGGTRQDTDGSVIQQMVEGFGLMIAFIDLLRQWRAVEIHLAAGNHDRLLSHALLLYLQGYYRACSRVTVTECVRPRQYVQYGSVMLGFTHGDGCRKTDLIQKILMDSQPTGTVRQWAWFTGHLHHEKAVDHNGVHFYQMPSLSGTDRWHEEHGYSGSRRGMTAYLICPQRGVRHQLHSCIL